MRTANGFREFLKFFSGIKVLFIASFLVTSSNLMYQTYNFVSFLSPSIIPIIINLVNQHNKLVNSF